MTETPFIQEPHDKPSTSPEGKGITSLPESLGYKETSELAELHDDLVGALRESLDFREIAERYQRLAEAVVDRMDNDNVVFGDIALTLQLGLIANQAGRRDLYMDYLFQARDYARNIGLDDILRSVEEMILLAEERD